MSSSVQRKFDRLVPGIATEERKFTNDLLGGGASIATHNSQIKQTVAQQEIGNNTKFKLIANIIFRPDEGIVEVEKVDEEIK